MTETSRRPIGRQKYVLGNYLIDPRFQLRLIGMLLAPIGFSFAVFYIAMQLLLTNFLSQLRETILPQESLYQQFVNDQRSTLNVVFLTTLFLVLFAMLLGALIVSHRIAGPLYRLKANLREVANGGEVRELRFRKDDYLQDIVGHYNSAMRHLQTARGLPLPPPEERVERSGQVR